MNNDIRNIGTMNRLITYFVEVLNWNIDQDEFEDIEDISYDFEAEDLGLKEEAFAKIKSLRQLPPLVEGQKWGIFSVEFDSKKFEITALRKVLSGLIPKKRNSADHAVWDQKDLLFICFWGEDNNRTIGIAHFEDKEIGLPQIKMIYCAPAIEDPMQIQKFELKLKNLEWPLNVYDTQKWHDDWAKTFTTGYRQTIHDASTLTIQLAVEARGIRDRILKTLEVETEKGYVHQLYQKFKETLIHDMTETQFADMYAQTVVYGLFSARCMDKSQDNFSAAEAVECIPNTNPFLKRLMKECLGSQNNNKLSYDELEIDNVVDLLLHTKTDAIIQDFNRQTGGGREDPVIHFYEEFLTAYDKEQKVQRGVYYTPQPVVNFIVRAVDSIIKTEFDLKDGLASTEIKKIKYMRDSKKRIDGFYRTQVEDTKEVPAIQILDPATGTGTFLRQTIIQIYEDFKDNNKGLSDSEMKIAWNEYVPKHLLPRLNGFELMMAPYAVAHMKLAMVLKDTGYDFDSRERLKVYLTNTLEEPGHSESQITLFDDPLATESIEANAIKKNNGINIIIGNPPYNVSSTNRNEWILNLIQPYKDGLTEKKLNLDDDYIKFLRFAQITADKADVAVIGFITNNSFIDGVTHRQIRKSLLNTFSDIYIIDLHGNVMKHEKTPNGDRDENVFDITQGVAICLFIKNKKKHVTQVKHFDLMGTRDYKYSFLSSSKIDNIEWNVLRPDKDKALFVPFNTVKQNQYINGVRVDKLFKLYNSGIQTKCDSLSVGMSVDEVKGVIENFINKPINELREIYPEKKDSSGWNFNKAKEEINTKKFCYTPYYYRPFDVRYTVYTGKSGGFIGRSREVVMKHVVGHKDNLCLCMMKQFFQDTVYNHALISNLPIDERTLYSNRGGTYIFPLYLFDNEDKSYNFNNDEISRFEKSLGLKLNVNKDDGFSGEQLISYVYATLYSNKFREEYNDYLKYDFPIIPLPKTAEYFFEMVELGEKLINIHLPDNFYHDNSHDDIIIQNLSTFSFEKKDYCIVLNKNYTIPVKWDGVYEYEIGGYKPIQKWLKDRKNKPLKSSDIVCINKIINTVQETVKIMERIDSIIEL
ncbi:type ISP restriction/modification enzyme [Oribacterium sp. P6A1]|uniref:type ISP restriction/modification enzyme n=1 Tax=Oribacterium sp. P6A1 TaxID=1410612 RepID=UPI00056779EA|nr:type ISP restriction/modification enzyme [Oribacterium sp. P6A1]